MLLKFVLSGSLVAEVRSDIVPPVGSRFTIETTHYKKGLYPGTILDVPVSDTFPPQFDFTGGEPVVYVDVSDYEIVREGPKTDER